MRAVKNLGLVLVGFCLLVAVGFLSSIGLFGAEPVYTVTALSSDTEVSTGTSYPYIESFDADYYLSQDDEGVSHLRIVENITTMFANYEQNKGICREIPITNHGGDNVTLPNLDERNFKVLRNGVSEPIYSIEMEGDFYRVCTGTEEYLMGEQVFTLEYEHEKVVTDFGDYQELYWDTNGNGWNQKFNHLTARVHFADEKTRDAYSGEQWCYVGKYGENLEGRCKISKIEDGVQFSADNLGRYENLTFDIELKPGSFVVPEPEKSYLLVVVMVATAVICGVILYFAIKKYHKQDEKRIFYKDYFVKPEYQTPNKYTVAEMGEIYMGKKKDLKVALLLKIIVEKKISVYKKEVEGVFKRLKWTVKVNDAEALDEEEQILLQILNGGDEVSTGDEIEIKRHTATTKLESIGRKFETKLIARVKKDGLVEKNFKYAGGTTSQAILGGALIFAFLAPMVLGVLLFVLGEVFGPLVRVIIKQQTGKVMVGEAAFLPLMALMLFGTFVACYTILAAARKYSVYKKLGLEMSRYMDGLKMYIEMAEADRMKFLQSVDGADTTADGMVKLYEKLLPYAAVFGLEKSWMKEFEEYCKVEEVDTTIDTMNAVMVSHMMSNYISSSSHYVSSSGGSSIGGGGGFSSSSSGGGGGGFSGGGGGGGGGGFR